MLIRLSAMSAVLVLLCIALGIEGTLKKHNKKVEVIKKLYNILNEVPKDLYNPVEKKIIHKMKKVMFWGTALNFNLTSNIVNRERDRTKECGKVKKINQKLQGKKLLLSKLNFEWLNWINDGSKKGIEVVQKFFSWLFYPKFQDLVPLEYTVEFHRVETEDGYILNLDRIPYGKRGRTGGNRPVVLLMHGLLCSSGNFLYHNPDYAIGYNLVDAGFDVWFGNTRGSLFSRKHKYLNPDDPKDKFKYFNFTWHNIAMNDLPAIIDHILVTTNKKKLHYIGHSQGGTIFLILNSMKPWYNEKFETAHLLSAAGYQREFPHRQMKLASRHVDFLYDTMKKNGLVEIVIHSKGFVSAQKLSKLNEFHRFYFELLQSGRDNLTANDLPGAAATAQFAHYLQNIRNKEFCQWDYGPKNIEVYGTPKPPNYKLNLITVKTTMYYSLADYVVSPGDTIAMARDMRNAQAVQVKDDKFAHSDYIESKDSKHLVTEDIIRRIKRSS